MLDSKPYKARCGDQSNTADLYKQRFYRLTNDHYMIFLTAHWAAVYAIGGVAGVVWRAFFTALLYHGARACLRVAPQQRRAVPCHEAAV